MLQYILTVGFVCLLLWPGAYVAAIGVASHQLRMLQTDEMHHRINSARHHAKCATNITGLPHVGKVSAQIHFYKMKGENTSLYRIAASIFHMTWFSFQYDTVANDGNVAEGVLAAVSERTLFPAGWLTWAETKMGTYEDVFKTGRDNEELVAKRGAGSVIWRFIR